MTRTMFTAALHFWAVALFSQPGDKQRLRVQLSGAETYSGWSIRWVDGTTHSVSDSGQADMLTSDEGDTLVEVLDEKKRIRYMGLLGSPNQEGLYTIQVGPGDMALHQVVSASRLQQTTWQAPLEMSVIQPDENPTRATHQTSDWLKEQAGINLQKTNLGGGSPIIRGMSGNRILLMVDGFRLNNGIFRLGLNQYLNTVPAGNLDQIEVAHGPTGVQYGSDGLGGTVHLRSSDPLESSGLRGGYEGLYSSADDTNTHQAFFSHSNERFAVRLHGAFNDYQDLKAGGQVDDQVPSGYDNVEGGINFSYAPSERVRWRFLNAYSNAENVPRTDRVVAGRDLLWEYDPQIFQMHGLRYEHKIDHHLLTHLDLGLAFMAQEEGTSRISSSDPSTLAHTRTNVDTLQFNGSFTAILGKNTLVYGFDSQFDSVAAYGFERDLNSGQSQEAAGKFPNDAAYDSFGIFVQADWQLSRKQSFKTGLRQSFVDMEGTLSQPIGLVNEAYSQLTPSINYAYSNANGYLGLGVSQGFRAPNLEDTLSLGFSNKGFDAPNPALQPEEMWNFEVIGRYRTRFHLFEGSVYHSRYQDLIERVPGSYQGMVEVDGEQVFILDNVGKAEVDGISLRYRAHLNKHQSLSSDLAWTEGTQTDRDEPMTRIPPLRGNINWHFKMKRWEASTTFTWAARQDRLSPSDLDDTRIPPDGTPGYGVLHLRGVWHINQALQLNLSLENATDKLYKVHGSGLYEPGRRALLRLKATLP